MGRCEGRVAGSAWPARFTGNAKIVSVSGIHHPVAVDTKTHLLQYDLLNN